MASTEKVEHQPRAKSTKTILVIAVGTIVVGLVIAVLAATIAADSSPAPWTRTLRDVVDEKSDLKWKSDNLEVATAEGNPTFQFDYGRLISPKFSAGFERNAVYQGIWAFTLSDPKGVELSDFAPEGGVVEILSEPPEVLVVSGRKMQDTWYALTAGPLEGAFLLRKIDVATGEAVGFFVLSWAHTCSDVARPKHLRTVPSEVCRHGPPKR